MATISKSRSNHEASRGIISVTWAAMGNADQGEYEQLSHWMDRTVQLFGTWGSATIVIQGSNDPRVISDAGNAVWETLRDPAGNALSFTANGLKAILELPRFIRPSSSGGTGTSVTVVINARREYA